ncbi:14028_t:CDS:2 [Dentiscutata heterogama]|uniref:14028_t:CDS:1 n=1 Tax=Dentiscutata heterogama TaxID=1316150 RepID=A0ACA9K9B9_9GLOM|nr:14028_t:CDS:2 [Dentiscutata heterogama]
MQYNSALTCVSCSLYQYKTFKNNRGLRLYWQRVYQSKNSNYSNQRHTNTSIFSCVFCILCPKKGYKNQKGLSRHETIVHSHYNTPQAGLIPQPLEAIIEFKSTLIYMIQIKLKTSAKEVRQQVITMPCLENQFISVNAYESLGQIFGDEKWEVHEYENKQQTWVILNMSEDEEVKCLRTIKKTSSN